MYIWTHEKLWLNKLKVVVENIKWMVIESHTLYYIHWPSNEHNWPYKLMTLTIQIIHLKKIL